MTIWRMYIACWIPKATNTHPEYIILIAFLLQQCLHERHSTLPVLLFVYVLSPLLFFLYFFSQEIQNGAKAQMYGRVDFMYIL